MPTYLYKCDSCEGTFEVFQSISDDPITLCRNCGEPHAHRVISGGAGIIFKGSGFYVNDSKKSSGSPKTNATESKTSAKTPDTSTNTQTNTKKDTSSTKSSTSKEAS